MAAILNKLETQQDIQNYKERLNNKSTSQLYWIFSIVERDMKSKITHYTNHKLRLELINEEITKRLN